MKLLDTKGSVMRDYNFPIDAIGLSNQDVAIVFIEMMGIEVTGTARRDPRDKPNEDIGQRLAMARAIQALGHRMERRVRGEIKHADDVAEMRKHKTARPTYGVPGRGAGRGMRGPSDRNRDL